MAMRETERSLRWYFWVAGAFAIIYACGNLSGAWDLTRGHPSWRFTLVAPLLARIALGGAFLVAGRKLKEALASDVTWIRWLVILAGAAQVAELGLIWLMFHDTLGNLGSLMIGATTTRCGIGVAITIYLHYNLMRLSREAKARLPAVFE